MTCVSAIADLGGSRRHIKAAKVFYPPFAPLWPRLGLPSQAEANFSKLNVNVIVQNFLGACAIIPGILQNRGFGSAKRLQIIRRYWTLDAASLLNRTGNYFRETGSSVARTGNSTCQKRSHQRLKVFGTQRSKSADPNIVRRVDVWRCETVTRSVNVQFCNAARKKSQRLSFRKLAEGLRPVSGAKA